MNEFSVIPVFGLLQVLLRGSIHRDKPGLIYAVIVGRTGRYQHLGTLTWLAIRRLTPCYASFVLTGNEACKTDVTVNAVLTNHLAG